MSGQGNPNGAEMEFRRTRRWTLILLALFFPVLLAGFKLNDVLHSEVPLTACVAVFFVVLIYVSVLSFISYYRWTGKYPFYWLRK
jgi:hypothetical protein